MIRFTARWLLPVTRRPIEDGALLTDAEGRIAAVGPESEVPRPPDAIAIDLGDAALLPGLVNVHAHPELTALRGLLEDLAFPDWIAALMRAKAGARMDSEDHAVAARWGCLEALRSGITTIAATETSAATFDALLGLGMRGIVYREVFGPSSGEADAAIDALARDIRLMRERENGRVRAGISPHAPFSVSDRLYALAAELARGEVLPIATHAAESQAERLLVSCGTGPFAERLRARGIATPVRAESTIALLERTGVLAERPLLIHCVDVGDEDLRRIAGAGAAVAHCPVANARLGHGIAPVFEMRRAGITTAIGTDSVASNNRMDLLEEARLAQILQRARLAAPDVLPAHELLRMVTLDGARALGCEDRIGSLDTGKDADLCAVSLATLASRPVHDPLAALFHSARAPDVILTAVQGRILFDGRDAHATQPDARLSSRLDDLAARLRAAVQAS